MAKLEWGTKRTCTGCGAKFYDFSNTPILCPACGVEFQVELRPRRVREEVRQAPKPAKPAPIEDDVDEEEDDDLLLDDDDDEDEDAEVADNVLAAEGDDDEDGEDDLAALTGESEKELAEGGDDETD